MSTGSSVNFEQVPFAMTLLVRDTCLCLHMQRAARTLARRFDEALKPVGLTNGQFSLLISLNRPDLPGIPRATMGSVATLLGMDRTTLTAAVKTLERRGLLEIRPVSSDKRIRHLLLTPAGRGVLALAAPIWTATHAEIESTLDSPQRLRAELSAVAGQPLATPPGQPLGVPPDQPLCAVTSATANPS
jgi:DNA-binding MarR family transcriptional regulator